MNGTMERTGKEETGFLQRRLEAAASYPALFKNLMDRWNSDDPGDCAWMLYSANYLLRTSGVRWAIDPLMLHKRVPETPAVDIDQVFKKLDFVVLTHAHADHLDFDLLRKLQDFPIQWVIPEFMLQRVQDNISLHGEKIILVRPFDAFTVQGIHFFPVEGHHFEEVPSAKEIRHGVPSMAYLVEFNGKRWFFPGDTRNYRQTFSLPSGSLDGMFAHLWLGRKSALMGEPPLLGEFCQFCTDLNPQRVILTHLEEFGRDGADTWELRHAQMVFARWNQLGLKIPIQAARMGDCILL